MRLYESVAILMKDARADTLYGFYLRILCRRIRLGFHGGYQAAPEIGRNLDISLLRPCINRRLYSAIEIYAADAPHEIAHFLCQHAVVYREDAVFRAEEGAATQLAYQLVYPLFERSVVEVTLGMENSEIIANAAYAHIFEKKQQCFQIVQLLLA